MNATEQFIRDTGMNDAAAMNALQGAGIVSDNAITAADIAGDHEAAIEFLSIMEAMKPQPANG